MRKLRNLLRDIKTTRINFFLGSILFGGLILRLFLILNRQIFTDEVFYVNTAKENSFFSIVISNHWLKDHGFLYLFFLKILQEITSNIILLRLSNLILYLVIFVSLYIYSKKYLNDIFSLMIVLLFSFFPFFIFLNAYISPYNFVMFFSILAFIYLSNFIFLSNSKKNKLRSAVLFIIFLTLAFYSDFSVIYFYLSLIPIIIFLFIWNQKVAEDVTFLGFINLILISPGLYILSQNFSTFPNLNQPAESSSFSLFVQNFTSILFIDEFFSKLIFISLLVFLVFIFLKSKNIIFRYFSFFSGAGFLVSLIFLYSFNNSYFYILGERTFWFFYFLLIIGISLCATYLSRSKIMFILYILIIISFLNLKFYKINNDLSVFGKNIEYKQVFSELMKDSTPKSNNLIVFVDNNYDSNVLTNYYFQGKDEILPSESTIISNFFKFRPMKTIRYSEEVADLKIKDRDEVVFLNFKEENYYHDLKNALNNYKNKRHLRISFIFYQLECSTSLCKFVKK